MPALDKIIIVDYGSQYTHLIARRIRELNVLSEIRPPSVSMDDLIKENPKGIILSGGPESVHCGNICFDSKLLDRSIPILGICYGMQLLNTLQQGTVKPMPAGEYGKQTLTLQYASPLFKGLEKEESVWMSHGDSIASLAPCFTPIGISRNQLIAAIQHTHLPQYGLQFHPEVTHTLKGKLILGNFLDICNCSRSWTLQHHTEAIVQEIQQQVGSGKVISLVSGGVDSTVATFLCYKALGPDRVIPIHIDTGLMRKGESQQVLQLLEQHGMQNLVFINASHQFLKALEGIIDPEDKRRIIGQLFIEILEKELINLEQSNHKIFLCQGTLYTDLIESGKGCGQQAAIIKSHHNVSPPIVEKKRKEGLIVEPNAKLFKDEVRELCEELGIPKQLAWRHPFPGPGLAIRILGEVTAERLEILRQADAIFLEEIHQAGLYASIWQAFAVLLPITTIGVMGDHRTEGHAIALRAVASVDGMTADFSIIPMEILSKISTRIVNEVSRINRVVYDVTSKPPATIEWL
jgi:GMP synthase (glutamine-hydrolysing)